MTGVNLKLIPISEASGYVGTICHKNGKKIRQHSVIIHIQTDPFFKWTGGFRWLGVCGNSDMGRVVTDTQQVRRGYKKILKEKCGVQ